MSTKYLLTNESSVNENSNIFNFLRVDSCGDYDPEFYERLEKRKITKKDYEIISDQSKCEEIRYWIETIINSGLKGHGLRLVLGKKLESLGLSSMYRDYIFEKLKRKKL
jgi:hypothetical protein